MQKERFIEEVSKKILAEKKNQVVESKQIQKRNLLS